MRKDKQAYLIIAHHEFELLQKLIEAIDDSRNDLYVHIDKKVKVLPTLKANHAQLFIIEDRVDVRWGHVSQIESEYALFEASFSSSERYNRYHLISGAHLPLKSQNEIHSYFETFQDEQVLNFLYTDNYETNLKLNRFHFFLRHYRSKNVVLQKVYQFFWHLSIKIQYKLHIQKKEPKVGCKANNWVSLTTPAVSLLLGNKDSILNTFRQSFCGDEFFVPYLLSQHPDRFKMIDDKNLLFNEFSGSFPRILTESDFDYLMESNYLFARKFSESDMNLVNRIVQRVKLSDKNTTT